MATHALVLPCLLVHLFFSRKEFLKALQVGACHNERNSHNCNESSLRGIYGLFCISYETSQGRILYSPRCRCSKLGCPMSSL
jgi:hypothetical protein